MKDLTFARAIMTVILTAMFTAGETFVISRKIGGPLFEDGTPVLLVVGLFFIALHGFFAVVHSRFFD